MGCGGDECFDGGVGEFGGVDEGEGLEGFAEGGEEGCEGCVGWEEGAFES